MRANAEIWLPLSLDERESSPPEEQELDFDLPFKPPDPDEELPF